MGLGTVMVMVLVLVMSGVDVYDGVCGDDVKTSLSSLSSLSYCDDGGDDLLSLHL